MLSFGIFKKFAAMAGLAPSATTSSAVTGVTLAPNNLVYVKSDGQLGLADASTEGKEAIGFVKYTYTVGQTANYFRSGNIISGLSGLIPGTSYFMSNVPGGISSTAPVGTGNVAMRIGTAVSTTEIAFAPTMPITL